MANTDNFTPDGVSITQGQGSLVGTPAGGDPSATRI
jgi:hypothetical protein